ncbi:MAG: preprotein translocase subunit SecA [Candidatus Brocadiaceae bacterium]|nr:preprotein translocase subunit SecA [Candidatus Brocadiaceae bacterium]
MWIADLPYAVAGRIRRRAIRPALEQVNALEAEVGRRSDADLKGAAARLRQRLSLGATQDELLPEAFALVREAARRTVGQRHYDVQVLGAAAIHRGWVAEMQTGEGKTLVATMPAFLNALPGRGVHVVTTNDYLAGRDAEWMGGIYRALGLTVGCVVHGMSDGDRVKAYQADITYGTNKEFAFDYLRDQLRQDAARRHRRGGILESSANAGPQRVQRSHHFAIVDEVDSILIDEARVPLIIAEREEAESPYAAAYRAARALALQLRAGRDYTLDMARRNVELTTSGIAQARRTPAPALPPNRPFEHLVRQALQAEHMFERDRDYLLVDGKVSIVDEFTGRMLADRSWSLGLHQSVETKEDVAVTDENRTLASVTFQRYFRLYKKLAGMTGTARESRGELRRVFNLPVLAVPTNRPLIRRAHPCRVFSTWDRKYAAILERIRELHAQGRPVLVGTRSVYRSEVISRMLTDCGIDHSVLNARHHAEEAAIVAEAGGPGRVTIATNMAGRGVDIMLGAGVEALGGLHVLGTELHEAARIDRQLGGRAARQGDPGSFEFFVSLEDELLVRWNRAVAAWLRRRAARRKGRPPGRHWILVFELAQRRIEARHLRIRLDLLERDKKLEEMKGTLGVPSWG